MSSLKNKPNNNEITLLLSGFVLLIIIVMLIHDYLVAFIFHSSYYFSESLLFKLTILLLFLPILIFKLNPKTVYTISPVNLAVYLIPICIFHILIASSLVALISQNFMDSSYTFVSLIKNKFANDLLLIMTCYILMFLMIRNHQLFSRTKKSITNKTLSIKTGNQTKIIQLDKIEWIQAETPYIGIWIEQNKYLYQSTLSKILTELDSEKFIRIHRSTIVNILEVEHIESRSNGDYDLFLWDKTVLRLSRNYRQNLNRTQLKP
jgi:hypothetical protein